MESASKFTISGFERKSLLVLAPFEHINTVSRMTKF
ncbi:hypothetical protein MXB_3556 [Myxobolus squamalis]|nr:hypothetical protein MXB_3556 [Myxobolus squamalis]